MGVKLCCCNNNNPESNSETSLVNIFIYNIYNERLIQAPKKIETLKSIPKKKETESNSRLRSINDDSSISRNEMKTINSRNSKVVKTFQEKEVSKFFLI